MDISVTLRRVSIFAAGLAVLGAISLHPARAEDQPTLNLAIREHRFDPASLDVPANVKFKLVVHNYDATPEEFESSSLHREKVVAGNSEITVVIGPLKPGTYSYYGEFHEDTAKGTLVAK